MSCVRLADALLLPRVVEEDHPEGLQAELPQSGEQRWVSGYLE
jgi:hypothetical protein